MSRLVKFRFHRGGFAESMATTREINPTIQKISDTIREEVCFNSERIDIKYIGIDERNGWITWQVSIQDIGVVGYMDKF